MIFKDQCRYAFGNLRKTLLRTILTAAGVSIGIGAMTSMVSVGLGTQRLVLRAFNEGNILSSIMVSPGESADTIFRVSGTRSLVSRSQDSCVTRTTRSFDASKACPQRSWKSRFGTVRSS
jgi:hypothetical protein